MRLSSSLALLLALGGCSVGGHYSNTGPHPHVTVAAKAHIGPLEVLHTSASNAKPVTDLTVATLNLGPTFGPVQPTLGLGWQFSRLWGACNSVGHECEKTWINGYAVAAGLTYRDDPFRIDLRAFAYDNSPVGGNFPLGIEALVLLFGFDL